MQSLCLWWCLVYPSSSFPATDSIWTFSCSPNSHRAHYWLWHAWINGSRVVRNHRNWEWNFYLLEFVDVVWCHFDKLLPSYANTAIHAKQPAQILCLTNFILILSTHSPPTAQYERNCFVTKTQLDCAKFQCWFAWHHGVAEAASLHCLCSGSRNGIDWRCGQRCRRDSWVVDNFQIVRLKCAQPSE